MRTNNEEKSIQALLKVIDTLTEAVHAAGPEGVPEGHLYAMLMGFGCTLGQFNTLVGAMVNTGKVNKSGHLLTAA